MRVICQTIYEWLDNLKLEKRVFTDSVWVSVVKRTDDDGPDPVKFEVIIQASAVIDRKDGQYILEVGQHCGTDFEDSTQEKKGSMTAENRRHEIAKYCKGRGLTVRPGVVDM